MSKVNVMLDLETMGTDKDAAIVAIGAVKFDNNCILDSFYAKIDLESSVDAGGTISPSTVKWWLKQSEDARQLFINEDNVMYIHSALSYFTMWLNEDEIVMWGNGSDFDNVILASAYSRCKMAMPWKFYNNRCYRTIKNYCHLKLINDGIEHNALDDAAAQARHLILILAQLDIKL